MFENISASYDVGVAKKYGINCAVLLNKLIYLSRYTSRKDGYCWRTSKELGDDLGLSRYQQDVAIEKLIEENLIETKNTYIIGTQIKCKHFKLLFDISKCDLRETNKSIDCRESNICDLRETNKSVNNNNTTNNNTSNNIYNNNIYDFIEENFGRTLNPLEYEEISTWEDNELTRYAIKEAILGGKYNIKYISVVLNSYKKNSITTVQQAQEEKESFKHKPKKEYKSAYEKRQEMYRRLEEEYDNQGN